MDTTYISIPCGRKPSPSTKFQHARPHAQRLTVAVRKEGLAVVTDTSSAFVFFAFQLLAVMSHSFVLTTKAMASEEPKTAPKEEAPASENKVAEANKNNGGKKNNGKRGQRDERPIEELYDLSKPIPRVSFAL